MTRSKELVFYSWIPLSPEVSRLSPFTYAQQHTRTSRTFYTFAVHQPKPPIITLQKGWTQANQSGTGPGVGNPNQYPKEASSQSKQGKLNQPSRFPLTNELLDPGEELLGELDYEDMEETNPDPDPEIAQAVAHIPQADVCADVEMQDVRPSPGFEPEVVKTGYDVNLVCSDQPEPGSSSPVTAGEDRMLDVEESQPRAPGNGQPGHNPDQAADN